MFRPGRRTRFALRTLAAAFGTVLLAYLIRRVGLQKIVETVSSLGWGLALIIALGGASHVVKAWAWRLTLTEWKDGVSFMRLLQLRLASEAVGQVGALGQLFGEGLRISRLSTKIPVDGRISSVTLDRALFIVTGAVVSVVGMVTALLVVSLSHAMRLYTFLVGATLISLLVIVGLAIIRRWPVLSGSAKALGRLTYFRDRVEGVLPLIRSVEKKLFDFHRHTPGAFWGSLTLNLACHGLAVLEVYLILCLLGVKTGFVAALVFESLTKLVNIVGTFNPGNIGTYEGGNMLIARMFGLSGASGIAVAVTRRLRALFWAAVGGVCLFLLSIPRESKFRAAYQEAS